MVGIMVQIIMIKIQDLRRNVDSTTKEETNEVIGISNNQNKKKSLFHDIHHDSKKVGSESSSTSHPIQLQLCY